MTKEEFEKLRQTIAYFGHWYDVIGEERVSILEKSIVYITSLEKKNAELKETVTKMNNVIIETFSNLSKAKEILQPVLDEWKENRWLLQSDEEVQKIENLMEQAEQFLQED